MLKVKHQRTADCVVGGYREHKDGGVGSLLLGLFDADGVLHHVGVASSFAAPLRKQLAEELAPYRDHALDDHPWREWAEADAESRASGQRRPGAQSRWNAGKDLTWEPLRVELVAEVAYEHLQGDRFRHTARFARWRPDREPESCTYAQLDAPGPDRAARSLRCLRRRLRGASRSGGRCPGRTALPAPARHHRARRAVAVGVPGHGVRDRRDRVVARSRPRSCRRRATRPRRRPSRSTPVTSRPRSAASATCASTARPRARGSRRCRGSGAPPTAGSAPTRTTRGTAIACSACSARSDDPEAVGAAIARWPAVELEDAIVAAGGCAAAVRSRRRVARAPPGCRARRVAAPGVEPHR